MDATLCGNPESVNKNVICDKAVDSIAEIRIFAMFRALPARGWFGWRSKKAVAGGREVCIFRMQSGAGIASCVWDG